MVQQESRGAPLQIVVVSKSVPWPPNSGEKLRTSGLVSMLSGIGDVTVVAFADEHDDDTIGSSRGVKVRAVRRREPTPLRWLLSSLRRRSITSGKWSDRRLRTAVDDELRRGVDIVVVCHVQLAHYVTPHLRPTMTSVLDMHNVESVLTDRHAQAAGMPARSLMKLEARALRHLERRAVRSFDVVSVVSDTDRRALRDLIEPREVEVLPNAIDLPAQELPQSAEVAVCFVGLMSWSPNVDAAVWFVTHVWSRILEVVPEAKLFIVGRDPRPAVVDLESESVVVTGTVDDVGPWYARSRVAVAPLVAGGGSRLKILEALSLGRPVVATRVGAEGLEDLVGRGVVTADDPQGFADAVVSLLSDQQENADVSRAGREAVRSSYTWPTASSTVVNRVLEMVEGRDG